MSNPSHWLTQLEKHLSRALRDLDELKRSLEGGAAPQWTSLTPVPLVPEVQGGDDFIAVVRAALLKGWGDERDFTQQTYQRLFEATGGDGRAVAIFLTELARRSRQPDSIGGYTVATFRNRYPHYRVLLRIDVSLRGEC